MAGKTGKKSVQQSVRASLGGGVKTKAEKRKVLERELIGTKDPKKKRQIRERLARL